MTIFDQEHGGLEVRETAGDVRSPSSLGLLPRLHQPVPSWTKQTQIVAAFLKRTSWPELTRFSCKQGPEAARAGSRAPGQVVSSGLSTMSILHS